jgi:hypothetical protein
MYVDYPYIFVDYRASIPNSLLPCPWTWSPLWIHEVLTDLVSLACNWSTISFMGPQDPGNPWARKRSDAMGIPHPGSKWRRTHHLSTWLSTHQSEIDFCPANLHCIRLVNANSMLTCCKTLPTNIVDAKQLINSDHRSKFGGECILFT